MTRNGAEARRADARHQQACRSRGREAGYARFREALLDLSEIPTPLNVQRYLEASSELERKPATPTGRPRGAR